MTDWIALGDALIVYRQPPEPRQATFKRLLDHHARGALECRAMLSALGRQPRQVAVPPQAWGHGAPFWFRLLDAIKADTFPVIWPRERDAMLWEVEFRGEGLGASPPPTLSAEQPPRVPKAEWEGVLRVKMKEGLGQVAALAALRSEFAGRALPSRSILREKARDVALELGRDPSRTGPPPATA